MSDHKTHFGFTTVNEEEKAGKVAEVFHSVAKNYDIMNDVMSAGLHRVWKHFTINTARLKKGDKVLDIAGGTGDLSRGWAKRVGKEGEVWLTDINSSMLTVGRDRLLNEGLILPVSLADAEKLPFPDNYFNLVSVAFGLRNMTHKMPHSKKCTVCSNRAERSWCWNFPKSTNHWKAHTICIPSNCCRLWANSLPKTQTAINIWQNPSACTLTRKH